MKFAGKFHTLVIYCPHAALLLPLSAVAGPPLPDPENNQEATGNLKLLGSN